MSARLFSLNSLLYLALLLALLSSLGHVAFAFSTVNGSNWIEAYISAVAIDLGLLALAAGINKRKSERRGTMTLWAGVILFSIISTYANWLAGIVHVTPLKADVTGIAAWLVSLRPILLSGVLPSLVIYLSEIVSSNYQNELTEAHKIARKVSKEVQPVVSNSQMTPANDTIDDTLAVARDTKQATVEERREKVLTLLDSGKSQPAIAEELQVSLATIKRDVKSLNGKVGVTL
jgi:Trp operon repressor